MREEKEEEYDPDLDYEPDPDMPEGPDIDPAQVQHYVDLLRTRQHMPMAVMAGFFGAVLGAAAHLAMTAMFKLEVGWMAIFTGVLVGVLMRLMGHGIDPPISIVAVVFTAVSIAAGTMLSGCALMAAQTKGATFVGLLSRLEPDMIVSAFTTTFDPVDMLFDVVGLVAAFVLARRRVRVKAIMAMAQRQRKAA